MIGDVCKSSNLPAGQEDISKTSTGFCYGATLMLKLVLSPASWQSVKQRTDKCQKGRSSRHVHGLTNGHRLASSQKLLIKLQQNIMYQKDQSQANIEEAVITI
jgi:hypothetical protein